MSDLASVPGLGMGGDPLLSAILDRGNAQEAEGKAAEQSFKESQAREAKARQAQAQAMRPTQERERALLQQGAPAAPADTPLPDAPKAPKMDTEQLGNMISLVAMLAAAGGHLTRAPLTAALNDFSAGIEGMKAGQDAQYQKSVKDFEANVKKANAEHDRAWEKYKAASEKYGTDIQGLQNELKLIAAETQNPIDIELATRGDIVSLMKLHETQANNYTKVLESVSSMRASQAQRDETHRHNVKMEDKGEGAASALAPGTDGTPGKGVEAATYAYLIKNETPPKRGPMYNATMQNIERVAKANGMTVQELISASADVKTRLLAKRAFEIRTQNLQRAENQLEFEIPVMEDAMKSLDLPSLPVAARGKIAVLREMGDPNVTKLDQAAEAVFNEFEGIITGNPGTLNVQDVAQAKHQYDAAKTPQQMRAAIDGMRRIISNAKKANNKTREEIMTDVNDTLGGKRPATSSAHAAALPDGWTVTEH